MRHFTFKPMMNISAMKTPIAGDPLAGQSALRREFLQIASIATEVSRERL
jgi:hypothetical protein